MALGFSEPPSGEAGDCGGMLVPPRAAEALEAWLEDGAPPVVFGLEFDEETGTWNRWVGCESTGEAASDGA